MSGRLFRRELPAALVESGRLFRRESTAALVGEWKILRKRVGSSEGEWTALWKRVDGGSEVVGSLEERCDRNWLFGREA